MLGRLLFRQIHITSCTKSRSHASTPGVAEADEVYDYIDDTSVQRRPGSQRYVDVGVHTQHHEYIGLPPRQRDNKDGDCSKLTASQRVSKDGEHLELTARQGDNNDGFYPEVKASQCDRNSNDYSKVNARQGDSKGNDYSDRK